MSRSSLALNNLRAFVILIVLAFHSVLAYLDSSPASPQPFSVPPYRWQAIPIIDSQRWLGFDLFCAFQDVYLMTFMFFLSGLFVWPSLVRKGSRKFLYDRFLRLGAPFVLGVYLLMPVAHYPVYSVTRSRPELGRVLAALARPADLAERADVVLVATAGAQHCRRRPVPVRAPLGRVSGLAVGLGARPSDPVLRRPGDGLRARLPPARRGFHAMGVGPTRSIRPSAQPAAALPRVFLCRRRDRGLRARARPARCGRHAGTALGRMVRGGARGVPALDRCDRADHDRVGERPAGVADGRQSRFRAVLRDGVLFLRSVFLSFAATRSPPFDSLSENAYGMYLVHYVFVVWLQYLLLGAALFAVGKAAVVFGATLLLSWATTAIMCRIPLGARIWGRSDTCSHEHLSRRGDRWRKPGRKPARQISAVNIKPEWNELRATAPAMSLIYRLASRNLLHDRLRFVATVVGIVFSIVLVTVQLGLYLGFGRMVTTMIDHASADLWIMPPGTKCFEDPSLLDERKRFQALSINGVAQAAPVVIGFADWRMPTGGTTPVFIVGSDLRAGGLLPWNVVEGSLDALSIPGAVAVDRSYFDRLGDQRDRRERRDPRAEGGGAGGHQRHPLVHDDALCLHDARSGARLYRNRRRTRPRIFSCAFLPAPTWKASAAGSRQISPMSTC